MSLPFPLVKDKYNKQEPRLITHKEGMNMLGWLIVGLAAGIFIGYKYPEQVTKAVDQGKKAFNDLKDKVTKKETPPPSSE